MRSLGKLLIQSHHAAPIQSPLCRRKICLRNRCCVPPPDRGYPGLYRCPHESYADWEARFPKVGEAMDDALQPFPLVRACLERMHANPGTDPWTALREVRAASAIGRGSGRGGSRPP